MINSYKFFEFYFCLGIMGAGISAMLVVFLRNIESVCSKGKNVGYCNKRKISVTAKEYLNCLGLQLLLGLIRLFSQQYVEFTFFTLIGNMLYYFFSSIGLLFVGVLNLANVIFLWERGKVHEIRKTWFASKIGIIPFFLLNWVHYVYMLKVPEGMPWSELLSVVVGAVFWGIAIFILPCVHNFLNGCAGWYYIGYLRRKYRGGKRPSRVHYVLQAVPVLDIISMILILKKYRQEEEAVETSSEELENQKHSDKVFVIASLSIVLLFTVSGVMGKVVEVIEIYRPKPVVYEMTEDEKRLLKGLHSNTSRRERVEKGNLSWMQVKELEVIRFAIDRLEDRYPEDQFSILGVSDNVYYYNFSIKGESSEDIFYMHVYDDKELTEQDNLYAYFYGEEYNAYLEEQLEGKIDGLVMVESIFWKKVDGERCADISLDTIINGDLDAAPVRVEIYISAKGKSEDECAALEEEIEEAVRELHAPTSFRVYFYDEEEQKILSGETGLEEIFYFPIYEEIDGKIK